MALKKKVTEQEFDALIAQIQGEYKLIEGSTDYELSIDGEEDNGALLRAKQHEKDARMTAEKKLKELQDKMDLAEETERKAREKAAREGGDIKALEKSWREKAAADALVLQKQIDALNGSLTTLTVDNVATQLAAKISTAPAVLLPHIKSRLRSEIVEGVATTRVLDAKGQPSALTVDELEKEFLANKDFSGIIRASSASGGGARGSDYGGGAPKNDGTKVDFKGTPAAIAASLAASGRLQQRS